jgi:excisionase family DNA binding protein
MGAMTGPLLTTREVAAILNVSPETVLRRWRRGEIPGFRIATNALRFDRNEIQARLDGTRTAPVGSVGSTDARRDRAS